MVSDFVCVAITLCVMLFSVPWHRHLRQIHQLRIAVSKITMFFREVVASLIDEYKACESPDYVNWGLGTGDGVPAAAQGEKEAAGAT